MDAIVKAVRPFESADYLLLKSATRGACELCGTLDEVARHTRLDKGTISRAGNPNENQFLPLDVALDLDALAGDDVILRSWANLRGYDLVPFNPRKRLSTLLAKLGLVSRETGELVSTAIDAQADGKVTPREAKEISNEALDVELAAHAIRREADGIKAN